MGVPVRLHLNSRQSIANGLLSELSNRELFCIFAGGLRGHQAAGIAAHRRAKFFFCRVHFFRTARARFFFAGQKLTFMSKS